jgi:hypothetical protein
MPPTIRIDAEVYAWLQLNARPFEDTPNSVLRRVAGLDHASPPSDMDDASLPVRGTTDRSSRKRLTIILPGKADPKHASAPATANSAPSQEDRVTDQVSANAQGSIRVNGSGRGRVGLDGKQLNEEWNVGARHALFSRDGTWYENLGSFPGALFDPKGYVLFETEEEYRNNARVKVGKKTNVAGGIASIPGYVRKA